MTPARCRPCGRRLSPPTTRRFCAAGAFSGDDLMPDATDRPARLTAEIAELRRRLAGVKLSPSVATNAHHARLRLLVKRVTLTEGRARFKVRIAAGEYEQEAAHVPALQLAFLPPATDEPKQREEARMRHGGLA
jgi:hypothetical protein